MEIWTRDTLHKLVSERFQNMKFIAVSNREPYIHTKEDGRIRCGTAASGLTTALDPILRASGGVWVAHGSGSADRDVVDAGDRIRVPPDSPSYTLRRVWLSERIERGVLLRAGKSRSLAALPRGIPPAAIYGEKLGQLSGSQRIFRGCHPGRSGRRVRSGLHPGLSSCAAAADAETEKSTADDCAVLAHPMAESGDLPRVSLEGRVAGWDAGQRSARVPPAIPLLELSGDD